VSVLVLALIAEIQSPIYINQPLNQIPLQFGHVPVRRKRVLFAMKQKTTDKPALALRTPGE
jgi:hypothetical protein